jgi:hypothetical protein
MPTFLQACQTPPINEPPASGQTRSLVWQCRPPTVRDTPRLVPVRPSCPTRTLDAIRGPSTHLPIREGLPYHPDGSSVGLVVRVLADASPPVRRSGAVVAFCCGTFGGCNARIFLTVGHQGVLTHCWLQDFPNCESSSAHGYIIQGVVRFHGSRSDSLLLRDDASSDFSRNGSCSSYRCAWEYHPPPAPMLWL